MTDPSLPSDDSGLLSRAVRLVARQAPIFAGSVLLVIAIAGGGAALANYLYDRQVSEASSAIKNLSFVISDHASRSMQAVGGSVSKVVNALQAHKPTSIANLEDLADTPELKALLDETVVSNPFLDSVFVIGADGNVDSRSRGEMIPAEMIAGREYMGALRNAGRGGFYLSTPFQSYRFRTWMLNFSEPVYGPGGAFLGGVAGIVRLSSFSNLFDKIDLSSNGSISLFGSDGRLLSWAPQQQMPFGGTLAGTPLFQDYLQPRRDGVTRARSDFDGVERLLAIANAADFPISTVIAIGMPDVVAAWSQQARWLALASGLAMAAIVAGSVQLAVRSDKVARERQRRALEKQMAEQAVTLSNAIENIMQGLAMFDGQGALVLYNVRYAQMYGLPLDKFEVGVTRAETIEPHKTRRVGESSEQALIDSDGSALSLNHLSDGRIIAQRKKTLPEGGWVSTHEDVTAKRAADDKIRVMATRDALTGLLNRFEFKDQLDKRLQESQRYGLKFAVFYIDLDRFKKINDTLGHPVGDELLREVAQRITTCVRKNDIVARLGGDEFAVLQRVEAVPRDPMKLAERLIALVSAPYFLGGNQMEIGTSIGISMTPTDSANADELMRDADLALYEAKQSGRGVFRFFEPSMHEQVQARRELELDLKAAIAGDQFELNYQPVVSTQDRSLKSFEALIRWRHPQRGLVSPADFIPLAEETGLITPIGEWVFREACRMVATLPKDIKVGVNVSPVQFGSSGLLGVIGSALEAAGVDGSRLIVEITEGAVVKDAEQAITILQSMRKLGIAIAMDDFGTGYSSLSYLQKFPFDKLKIDKAFIGNLGVDASAATIVRAAVALAGALGLTSVAEGIETEEQMSFLVEAGCAEAQGYLISKPLPAADVYRRLGLEPPARPAPLESEAADNSFAENPRMVVSIAARRPEDLDTEFTRKPLTTKPPPFRHVRKDQAAVYPFSEFSRSRSPQ